MEGSPRRTHICSSVWRMNVSERCSTSELEGWRGALAVTWPVLPGALENSSNEKCPPPGHGEWCALCAVSVLVQIF